MAKFFVGVFSCRVETPKSPQRQFYAVIRHDDETLLEFWNMDVEWVSFAHEESAC